MRYAFVLTHLNPYIFRTVHSRAYTHLYTDIYGTNFN